MKKLLCIFLLLAAPVLATDCWNVLVPAGTDLSSIGYPGAGSPGATGDTGPMGTNGTAAGVTVGGTTNIAVGGTASVTNSGVSTNAILWFGIPVGATGATGATGPMGTNGVNGTNGLTLIDQDGTNYIRDWSNKTNTPTTLAGYGITDGEAKWIAVSNTVTTGAAAGATAVQPADIAGMVTNNGSGYALGGIYNQDGTNYSGTAYAEKDWVRSLFGQNYLLYNMTNKHPVNTNWYIMGDTTNLVQAFRTYAGVTNNQYLGYGIMSTQKFTKLSGDIVVNIYLSRTSSGSQSASGNPEIYGSYNGTDTAFEWDTAQPQSISGTGSNLYTFIVSGLEQNATNSAGFYLMRRFKIKTQNQNPDVTIWGSGNTPSTVGFTTTPVTDPSLGVRGATNATQNGVNATYDSTLRVLTLPTAVMTNDTRDVTLSSLSHGSNWWVNAKGNLCIGSNNTANSDVPLYLRQSVVGERTGIDFANNDYIDGSTGSGMSIWAGAATGDTYFRIQPTTAGGTSAGNLVLCDQGGNLGVFNINPQAKLHVDGNTFVSNEIRSFAASDTMGAATYGMGTVPGGVMWELRRTLAETNLAIDYYNGAWSNAMMFQIKSGHVGINATNPLYQLQVNGDMYLNGALNERLLLNNGMIISQRSSSGATNNIFTLYSDDVLYFDNPAGRMVLRPKSGVGGLEIQAAGAGNLTVHGATGYTGINTTNPVAWLDVSGGVRCASMTCLGTLTAGALSTTGTCASATSTQTVSWIGGYCITNGIVGGTNGMVYNRFGTNWFIGMP